MESCPPGHSGAVMAGALFVLGRTGSVQRPAVAAMFPALHGSGRCLLLDAGANVECKSAHLAQFAVMGEAYVRTVQKVDRPRVAVLSNGEEESKGTDLTRDVCAMLKKSDLNFRGYVEGKDIFSGEVEVVVTDGFTGNVVLKTSEGTAMALAGLVRAAVERAGFSEKIRRSVDVAHLHRFEEGRGLRRIRRGAAARRGRRGHPRARPVER